MADGNGTRAHPRLAPPDCAVLVAHPEPSRRRWLADALHLDGYKQVFEAESAREVYRHILPEGEASQPIPALLLLSTSLRDAEGRCLFTSLRRLTRGPALLLVHDDQADRDAENSLSSADMVFVWPFDRDDFRTVALAMVLRTVRGPPTKQTARTSEEPIDQVG